METHSEILLGSLLLSVLIFLRQGVVPITVNQSAVPTLPILGNDIFTLQCFFTLSQSPPEELQAMILERKRNSDDQFNQIVTFPSGTSVFDPTFQDTALEQRYEAIKPENALSSSAALTCNTTECGDRAVYKWSISYFTGQNHIQEIETDLKIQVNGTFSGSTDYGLKYSPYMDIIEGTNVTFTCLADIGVEPLGQLEWYYYLPAIANPESVSHLAFNGPAYPVRTCSFAQESTLTLTMIREYNGIIVRCTLQQNTITPDGDDHRQTDAISVIAAPSTSLNVTTPASENTTTSGLSSSTTKDFTQKPSASDGIHLPAFPIVFMGLFLQQVSSIVTPA